MKKLFYLYISILVLTLSSCHLESMQDNGDLTGFWHLERIDTIQTGGVNDLSGRRIFWAVENKMLVMQGANGNYSFRFRQTGDSLILSDPYRNYGHEEEGQGGDVKVTDPSVLHQYGIHHLEEHFHKDKLKGTDMVLSTDSLRLQFKKF